MTNDKSTDTYKVELNTDDCADEHEWSWLCLGAQAHIDDRGVEYFHVSGRDMLWDRVAGYTIAERERVIDALSLNGSFRLVFSFAEGSKTFTAIRYSHDEPVGASFTIREATEEEVNEYENNYK